MNIIWEIDAKTGDMLVKIRITDHDQMRVRFNDFETAVMRTPRTKLSDRTMDLNIWAQALERQEAAALAHESTVEGAKISA